jgi:hypothetical protein
MPRCSVCFRRIAHDATCPRHAAATLHDDAPRSAASRANAPEIPGYELAGLLGGGAHASVWRARRRQDAGDGPGAGNASEGEVAIKVAAAITAQASERMARERDMLARIGAPHVPALSDLGELADGRGYLVMEKLTGPTLGARMSHMRAPPVPERLAALADTFLAALAAVHGAGVVHGDIKPDHVFIEDGTPHVRAVLVDLGLARLAGTPSTGLPSAAGTLLYMAPEQLDGAPADYRSDVYAAGVLLFELCVLQPPFGGDATTVELGHRVRRPPRPSSIAPVAQAVEDVILRCLAKDPAQRPAHADALRAALAAAFAEVPRVAVPAPAAGKADEPQTMLDAAAPKALGQSRGKRRQSTVAVAFLQASADAVHEIHTAVESAGGWLADFAGPRYAVVFTHDATDNPVRRAVDVSQSLIDRGLCRRAVIDLATVLVRWRANGQPWFVSNVFSRPERYPTDADPEGVTLTDAVAAALPSIEGDAHTARTARAAPRLWQRPSTARLRVRTAPFVGREDILTALLSDFRAAMREVTPALTTMTAAPGMGKSSVGGIVVERITMHYPWVQIRELRAHAPVGNDRTPLLRELLTWVLGLPSHSPGDAGRELIHQRLGAELGHEAWPSVALAMGWIDADAPAVRALGVAPGTLRTATARALGEVLVRLAAKRPQVLVLDDAQWADDTVLDALEYATAAGRSAEIWCLVLARPAFADLRPDWGQRTARHHTRQLLPLSQDDARDLCRRLLAPAQDVPEAIVDRLVARAGRIPMLLVELVRGLMRQELVKPHEREAGWYVDTDVLDALPDTPLIDWLTQRELEALTPEQAAHARMLSLLGPEFSPDVVEGVLSGLDRMGRAGDVPLDARVGLEQLTDAGLLFAHRRGTFSFRHALIREAVAATVEPASAVDIHRAAYQYYAAVPQPMPAGHLARMAWHAEQHGARAAALEAYRTMAEEALGKHEYLRAEQLFTRVLALLDDGDRRRRMWARRWRGIMRYRLSRHEDAIADLAAARADAQALADIESEIDLLLDEAMALDWLGQFEHAAQLTAAAEQRLAEVTSPPLEARVLMSRGRAALRADALERAVELTALAAARAEALGDACYETLVVARLMLGGLYAWFHRLDEAETVFKRVIDQCRAHNDMLHLTAALGNRVHLWAARGNWYRMSADLEDHHVMAQALGNARMERNAHYNAATFYYWRGDLANARQHLERGLALDDRSAYPLRTEGLLLRARVELAAGNLEIARAIAADIDAQQAAAERQGQQEAILRPSDRLLLGMLHLAVRDDANGRAWDELIERARGQSLAYELVEIHDARARAALRAGHVTEAHTAWQMALSLAQPSAAFMAERLQAALASLTGPAER